MSRDPVCGKDVDPLRARGVGIWNGRTYYFCSLEHRAAFARDPSAYRDSGGTVAPPASLPAEKRRATPMATTAATATPTPLPAAPSERVHEGKTERTPAPSHAAGEARGEMILDEAESDPVLPRMRRTWMYAVLFVAVATFVFAAVVLLRH